MILKPKAKAMVKVTSEKSDPFEIFTTSKLERIMNGALKETIRAHGPVDVNGISSVSKRACIQLRAYLRQFTSQQLLEESTKQIVEAAEQSNVDLREHNRRLTKQVAFLGEELRKIRDGESENPSETAKEAIVQARSIRKEEKCQQISGSELSSEL